MAASDYIEFALQLIGRLETPHILGIFLLTAGISFLLVERIGKQHIKRDIHKAVNLGISIIIALLLIAVSTAIGFL